MRQAQMMSNGVDEKNFHHISVMLKECIDGLNINSNGIYIDGTTGGAGHSKEIASRLDHGKLVCIDKDDDALSVARQRLATFGDKIIFAKSDFKNFDKVLDDNNIDKVDGILLDLGVSSYQLDTAERGFSYRYDAPLDMRMDKSQSFSAYDVVNNYSEYDIRRILYNYGEESFAHLIAKKIVETRSAHPISTTGQLKDIIISCMPKKLQGIGACKKTFQAIRIEVNGELDGLDHALEKMIDRLKLGGRLVVLTFHSLEDRIVKNVFRIACTDCICDKSLPVCICHHKKVAKLVNHKPITASKDELLYNSRSASAKLRILEKL